MSKTSCLGGHLTGCSRNSLISSAESLSESNKILSEASEEESHHRLYIGNESHLLCYVKEEETHLYLCCTGGCCGYNSNTVDEYLEFCRITKKIGVSSLPVVGYVTHRKSPVKETVLICCLTAFGCTSSSISLLALGGSMAGFLREKKPPLGGGCSTIPDFSLSLADSRDDLDDFVIAKK